MKKCRDCGQTKPLTEFYPHKPGGSSSRRDRCKLCESRYGRIHREAKKHYPALFQQQGGVCYVCRRPETALDNNGLVRNLCIDIDYQRGWIAGLACSECNKIIEVFRRNPAMLLAFQYALERNRYDINQPRIAA